MPGAWGKPPYHKPGQDFKSLAFWVVIVGIGLFLLFPGYFKSIYTNLTETSAQSDDLGDVVLPSSADLAGSGGSTKNGTSIVGSENSEISSGYWIIFVGDGGFKQLSVSNETYNFLLNLIQSDSGNKSSSQTVILAANGQVAKYEVSEEVYDIISNIAVINGRTVQGSQA